MKKFFSILLAVVMIALTIGSVPAESADAVAVVNGEAITQAELDAMIETLTSRMAQYGIDTTDESIQEVIRTSALDELVDDRLLTQDMTALGCYDTTEDEDSAITVAAQVSYENLLAEYTAYFETYLEGKDIGMTPAEYAETYMNAYGYTLAYVENYYRNAIASDKYEQLLMQDQPAITDEEVRAAYEQRVASSKASFENDAAAFETALYNSQEAWYRPDGYRGILQIMLSTEGEDDAARLASVKEKTDDIMARLAAGEDFVALIAEYGEDTAFEDPEFCQTGYQVHRDSVIWDESFVEVAFSDALQNPGDYTQPAVYGESVHIFYYLKDIPGGAVDLTEALAESLADDLYSSRCEEVLQAHLAELKAAAEITY